MKRGRIGWREREEKEKGGGKLFHVSKKIGGEREQEGIQRKEKKCYTYGGFSLPSVGRAPS